MDAQTLLSKCFLFRNLPAADLAPVAAIAQERHVAAGEMIFFAQDEGDEMFLIRLGSVSVQKDGNELAKLATGSHFGEIALADQLPRSATVTGVAFGSLITIGQEQVLEFCRREPELGNQILWKLLRTLARRLRETNALVAGQPDYD